MSTPCSIFLLAATLSAAASPGAPAVPKSWSARDRVAASAISPEVIAAHVRFLADDLLEGRAPGSRGSEVAMKYVATEFERLGLEPAGENKTYLQKFDIVGLRSEVAQKPTFTAVKGGQPLVLTPGADSIVSPGSQKPTAELHDAEVVFVGYGITAPEQGWDDFKDIDVRGKVLLVMNNDPSEDPALFAGKTRLYYGRWTYKFEQAARKGAAAVIIIHTEPSAGYPWQVVQSSWSGEQFELPAESEPRLLMRMWATDAASRHLASLGGFDLDELRRRAEKRDFRPVPLGIKLSVGIKTKVRRLQTANVIGRLLGSDPRLKDQVIVYSAHHDHLGIGAPKGGDSIYNGALDNAAGVAGMLAIAQGMAQANPHPRRSVLFAAVAAEESGLLGSQYFCTHPVIPAGRIAANINIDGINIWGRTRDVTFVGMGKSSLDGVVQGLAKSQDRIVKPDQFPDRGHFYRSDQFNFARIGVPAVYLDTGTEFLGKPADWGRQQIEEWERTRYHQPSDQIDASWNFDGALDDMRLLLAVGLRVADAPAMPTWKPGDEFEAARKQALERAGAGSAP